MRSTKIDYTIYLVTDSELMSTETVEESVKLAIQGGVTVVQLREKNATSSEFYHTAIKVREITKNHNIPLIVNDRVDIALAIDADGVHVGQSDLPAGVIRKIIGDNKIIGVSASNLADAQKAVQDGADYIGVGAMYATSTKNDADVTSIDELNRIRSSISIPIVVIGGINKDTIPCFADIDIDGIAVVSAIISQKDIVQSANEIKALFNMRRK